MNRSAKIVGVALAGLLAVPAVRAAYTDSTYAGIAKRNVFQLVTPEIPRHPEPVRPLPEITLLGITTIFNDKRAAIKVRFPGPANVSAKEEYYFLAEGQRAAAIEILKIDERAGSVQLRNTGNAQSLAFKAR
jgi:hypothetical protein